MLHREISGANLSGPDRADHGLVREAAPGACPSSCGGLAANDFERSVTQSFNDWLCLNWGQLNLDFKPLRGVQNVNEAIATIELFYGNIAYLFFVEMQSYGQGLLKELWQNLFCHKESLDCLFGFVFAKAQKHHERLSEAVYYAIKAKTSSNKPISGVFPCKTHNLGHI